MRFVYLICFLLLALTACANPKSETPTEDISVVETLRPNIVLLIGDDHGFPYFGFNGDPNVHTPNMDRLARQGTAFLQGHVTASYCRPSLRTLITGLHPVTYAQQRADIVEEAREDYSNYSTLNPAARRQWEVIQTAAAMKQFETLPKLLKSKGYVSWQGGKWWENSYRNGHFDAGMSDGWDMSKFGSDDFFLEMMGADGTELGRTTMQPLYDFVDANTEQPFFIWYGPSLPHTPFDAPQKYLDIYADKDISDSAKLYYANISWWDDGVGQMMDYLEQVGELDDTLFIYVNDNGWEQEPDVEYKKPGSTYRNDSLFANGGYKGKNGLNDLSFRTPIIFHWPERIPAQMNDDSLVSSLDIVPTVLDMLDIEEPEGLQGYSVKPLIEKTSMTERDHMIGYVDIRRDASSPMGLKTEGYYYRDRKWHFMWYADSGEMALYDIQNDPKESKNVLTSHADLVKNFKDKIEMWKSEMGMTGHVVVHE